MPVESRQGPIFFHAIRTNKYRDEYDRIFNKKTLKVTKAPASKPAAKKTKKPKSNVDNT